MMSAKDVSLRLTNNYTNHIDKFTQCKQDGETFETLYTYDNDTFIKIYEEELDKEFQKATKSYENFDITPPKETLCLRVVNGYMANGETFALSIATGVMEYWSKAIGLLNPHSGNVSVDKVINDALSHITPLYNDILSIRTNSISTPSFLKINEKIIKHVKNIKWTIDETDAVGDTVTYIENVK